MSRIQISRNHSAGLEGARAAADQIAQEMADSFGVQSVWSGDELRFKHSAVRGQIFVSEVSIEVDARLGLLLVAMKPLLVTKINQYIDERLA
ncbi:MAG: polyhydroxyalkanoic acid system family protein [Pseudomonadota bacterium]